MTRHVVQHAAMLSLTAAEQAALNALPADDRKALKAEWEPEPAEVAALAANPFARLLDLVIHDPAKIGAGAVFAPGDLTFKAWADDTRWVEVEGFARDGTLARAEIVATVHKPRSELLWKCTAAEFDPATVAAWIVATLTDDADGEPRP